MQFSSAAEFFHMAGHGPYVWAAYAMFFVVIFCLIALPLRAHGQALSTIAQKMRLQDRAETMNTETKL